MAVERVRAMSMEVRRSVASQSTSFCTLRISRQKQNTSRNDCTRNHCKHLYPLSASCSSHAKGAGGQSQRRTYNLSSNSTLHKCLPSRIPINSLDVIVQSRDQACHSQEPEYESKGQSDSLFESAGLVFQVERDEDCNGDDCHVGC